MIRTLFFGSSSYCLPLAVSLHKNTDLIGIVTRPDASFGRNKAILPSPIKSYAKSNQIKYFTPSNKEELISLIDIIKDLNPDIALVADYGLIIPPKVFNIPKFKTLNVHFGKLPEYRGAAPLQWSIANGKKNIPISIILMDKGLDTGDIITEINYATYGDKTSGELYPLLFNVAADYLPKVIDDFVKGNLKPHKQPDKNIFVTERLTRDDGFIPWEILINIIQSTSVIPAQAGIHGSQPVNTDGSRVKPGMTISPNDIRSLSSIVQSAFSFSPSRPFALSLFNLYRALSPWPGLWTTIESTNNPINKSSNQLMGKRLKILTINYQPSTNNLEIKTVQLEGKKPVPWAQFKKAYLSFCDSN